VRPMFVTSCGRLRTYTVTGGGPVPYTVKQVSALTGIAPDRLRAWERRYGVVHPTRTDAGYRLYDDADLARLRLMMRLVEAGTPASLAAQQVNGTPGTAAEQDRPAAAPTPAPE